MINTRNITMLLCFIATLASAQLFAMKKEELFNDWDDALKIKVLFLNLMITDFLEAEQCLNQQRID